MSSKSNKECNASVEVYGGMGMGIPDGLKKKMEEWKAKFGELPADLEFGFLKD